MSIFERTMRSAIAEGRAALDGLHPEASLRRIARLHLERLGADRDLAVVFQIELRGTTKFMERFSATYVREYLGIIRDVIADGQARRVFRAGINPTLVAKALVRRTRRDGDQLGVEPTHLRPCRRCGPDCRPDPEWRAHGAKGVRPLPCLGLGVWSLR